ncbi:MAG: sortase [Chloroflexi bacterium]|nr:sortase [Chloroflexota bacterium]
MRAKSTSRVLRFISNLLIIGGLALFGAGLFVTLRDNFVTIPAALAHVPQPPPITAQQPVDPAAVAATNTPIPTNTPYASPTPIPVATEPVVVQAAPTEIPSPTPVPATATPLPTATRVPPTPTQVVYEEPIEIQIPSIGVKSKVVEVGWKTFQQGSQFISEWETADYAVGHHKFSALPGMEGNMVMSGHNNIKGSVFRDLADIPLGAEIILSTQDRKFYYRVEDNFITKEAGVSEEQHQKNAEWIAPTTDERLTLVSCWPVWTNTHRVIVIAKPMLAPTPAAQ